MTTVPRQAPGDLDIVRVFVNTRDVEEGTDALSKPEGLRDWLAAQGLLESDAPVNADDVGLAHDVREALRDLLLCNNEGCEPERQVVLALNDAAALAQLSVRFHEDGSAHLEPAVPGVPGAGRRGDRLRLRRGEAGASEGLQRHLRWAFFGKARTTPALAAWPLWQPSRRRAPAGAAGLAARGVVET
jgi:hypothetical protein